MSSGLRNGLKHLLYRTGLIPRYHRRRVRDVLTVVMLHRVLPRDDPRWRTSLADWTVDPALLDACLGFVERHYNVVTLGAVLEALDGGRPLPPRSMLLTFDDGYADVEEYALPLLRRHELPAAVFVTSDTVGRRQRPWTEDFWFAYLNEELTADEVAAVYRALSPGAAVRPGDTHAMASAITTRCAGLGEEEVEAALALLHRPLTRVDDPPQMLSLEQLRRLHACGVAVGAHGRSHVGFAAVPELDHELRLPRHVLADMLELPRESGIEALAFPFGEHSPEIDARVADAGYRLAFSMSHELQPAPRGRPVSRVVGRVNLHAPAFAPGGRFRPELAALILAHTPRAAVPDTLDGPTCGAPRTPVHTPVRVAVRPAAHGGRSER